MASDKFRWQSISNHLCGGELSTFERKEIVWWEALQQSGFSESDRAVFCRMQEAPFRRIAASTRNGRRYFIPRHAAIDILEPIGIMHLTNFLFLVSCGYENEASAKRLNPDSTV